MPAKVWPLIDENRAMRDEQSSLGPDNVPGGCPDFSILMRRLRGGLREGVEVVEVNNGKLRVAVLPTRGMGLWKAWLGDLEIGWKSPVGGPVHPQFVPLAEPSGLGWLDGFDELLVRCGLESNGAPDFDERGILKYPLHGKIANRPAHHLEAAVDPEAGEIRLTGVVDETRFHFQKLRLTSTVSTGFGAASLRIVDEVENLSGHPAELELIYHVNFGQPLLDPGAQVVAAVKSLVPRDARAAAGIANWEHYGNEEPGFTEQVYFADLWADADGMSRVLLKNAHANQGVSLRFSKEALPHLTIWKNTAPAADGYVTGLEPGTNFPNPRSFEAEQGRVVKLEPGAKLQFELELAVHGDAASVAHVEQGIVKLQSGKQPKIFKTPQPGWSKI